MNMMGNPDNPVNNNQGNAGDPASHEGHRQRMKQRFEKNGFVGFTQHEIIEMILFYAFPRIDTNPIAHDLIRTFGSLSGVMDAPVENLERECGLPHHAALLLKMFPEAINAYNESHLMSVSYDTTEKMKSYFKFAFSDALEEEFRMACFYNDMRLQCCYVINRGCFSNTPINMHRIAEALVATNSIFIAIAHNHPDKTSEPSESDIFATRHILDFMRNMGVTLVDHIIVGNDGVYSMRDSAVLTAFDK